MAAMPSPPDDGTSAKHDAADQPSRSVLAEISVGELIDKITILEIKSERITEAARRANIQKELAALNAARDRCLGHPEGLNELAAELKAVNETLWQVEDDIRCSEREGRFDRHFIELARSVYRTNDRRSALKRAINERYGSALVEEKSYTPYE
jgi:hypothetical protein